MDIINLILTLIIAILGGYLASKKKVPAAYMLGALFLVALFNICSNKAFLPNYFKFITQIATGTFIGSKFRSEDIKMLKKVIIPGMTMVLLMITFSFILSYLMSTFLGIDNLTSFFVSLSANWMWPCRNKGGMQGSTKLLRRHRILPAHSVSTSRPARIRFR